MPSENYPKPGSSISNPTEFREHMIADVDKAIMNLSALKESLKKNMKREVIKVEYNDAMSCMNKLFRKLSRYYDMYKETD